MTNTPEWLAELHHDGSAVYVRPERPRAGDTITIRLRTPKTASLNHVFLQTMWDGELLLLKMQPGTTQGDTQFWTVGLDAGQPRFNYRFKLMTDKGAFFYTATGISRAELPDSTDFRLIVNYDAPFWVRDTVFYQIFPERFHNGDPDNDVQTDEYEHMGRRTIQRKWGEPPLSWSQAGNVDFYGGDLQGITQRLDYLADLGITGLYLTPIFTASSNHKYDIEDFYTVDKHFGGNDALVELREASREKQMRLMLDITPNHISSKHAWYTAYQADEHAPTGDYFALNPSGEIETWLGVSTLIKLNYSSQSLREMMYRRDDAVLRHWLKAPYSIDGWRLDVANMTGNLRMQQLDHEVWREMRPILRDENPDLYLMGENFFDGTMHTQGDELDAIMNYRGFNIPVRRWLGGEDAGRDHKDTTLLPTEALAEQMQAYLAAVPYPIALQQFNQLDSHDTTRILHVVAGDTNLVKLAIALLMAFPGVPCLYYGTEIGLDGGYDPDNRRTMPWNEDDWNTDLLSHTKAWIQARHESSALKHGGIEFLYAEGETLVFARHSPEQVLIFIGYRGKKPSGDIRIKIPGIAADAMLKECITDETYQVKNNVLTLSGLSSGEALLLEIASE